MDHVDRYHVLTGHLRHLNTIVESLIHPEAEAVLLAKIDKVKECAKAYLDAPKPVQKAA